MSSKKPTDTARVEEKGGDMGADHDQLSPGSFVSKNDGGERKVMGMYVQRMPSSSEDLTLARMTSEANGRKTTSRNTTGTK